MESNTSWVLQKPIAHRGLHNFEFPENSVPSFENAIKHGFAIELDVRLTEDHTIRRALRISSSTRPSTAYPPSRKCWKR